MEKKDKGYTWAQVADEFAIMKDLELGPYDQENKLYSEGLLNFLKLIDTTDFKFRYEPGDPKTAGIEARHHVLKRFISDLEKKSK